VLFISFCRCRVEGKKGRIVPMKTTIPQSLIVTLIVCLGSLQDTQAVNPPPDGGYPNFNTAEGQNALFSLTTGVANAAVGWYSLFSNTDGSFNTALGTGTLLFNVGDQNTGNGTQNTAIGAAALLGNTTGAHNTATGSGALVSNSTGSFNTATGVNALSSNTGGVSNNALGWGAMLSNTTGSNNTAVGVRALEDNTVGAANIALGEQALANNVSGNGNVAVGYQAAINANGSNNTALGASAGLAWGVAGANVCIGQGVTGSFFDGGITRIRNIGTLALGGATNVVIASIGGIGDGELGYNAFSRRYYEDIQPVDKASETLLALRPVSFRAKNNVGAANVKLYGLIAEDVATVDPDLVVYNSDGQPETLRLDSINAMLLNEFLKARRQIDAQQKQIETLTAGLQKVSAQLATANGAAGIRSDIDASNREADMSGSE